MFNVTAPSKPGPPMFATVPVSLYTCSATNLLTALTAWVGGAGAWCKHAPLARLCIMAQFVSFVSWFIMLEC